MTGETNGIGAYLKTVTCDGGWPVARKRRCLHVAGDTLVGDEQRMRRR